MEGEWFKMAVGQKIRKYRKQNFKSIAQLAEEIGIDEKHLGEIERGNHNTTLMIFQELYKVLDLPDRIWGEINQDLQHEEKSL